MNRCWVRLFSLLTALTVCIAAAPPAARSSEWIGGVGDWFDPANWDAGVPGPFLQGRVNTGEAHFSTPVDVLQFLLAYQSSPGNVNLLARVVGSGDLDVTNLVFVGVLNTSGMQQADGLLTLDDGDVSALRFVVGSAGALSGTLNAKGGIQLSDGSLISQDTVVVGEAGGTSSPILTGIGDIRIERGDLRAVGALVVGDVGGTGSATATAHGSVSVKDGDVNVAEIRIGMSTGTGSFKGDATGSLVVENGDVVTTNVRVGLTSKISEATGRSDAQFKIVDGDLSMTTMIVGQSTGGPSDGIFEQHGGVTTGDSLVVGPSSRVVLGIDGTAVGEDYAQLQIGQVAIGGALEAQFAPSFSPLPGMSFDLIVAQSITSTELVVTGLEPAIRSAMRVQASPTLLRIIFVPEPTTPAIAATCLLALAFTRRRPAMVMAA